MIILTNTGHNIRGRKEMVAHSESVVESTLNHLAEHITRVEVFLSDENSKKEGGHDKRCVMEARLKGHQPVAVTAEAATFGQAITEAADKLKRSLDHTIGRLNDHKNRRRLNIDTSNDRVELAV